MRKSLLGDGTRNACTYKSNNAFQGILVTQQILVYTDHKALTWLKTITHTNARLIRWALKLQEYSFEIKHRPGSQHQNSDALSRRPQASPDEDEEYKQSLE